MSQSEEIRDNINFDINRIRELDSELAHAFQAIISRPLRLTNEQFGYLRAVTFRCVELLQTQQRISD